jgi:hypothetical protein
MAIYIKGESKMKKKLNWEILRKGWKPEGRKKLVCGTCPVYKYKKNK